MALNDDQELLRDAVRRKIEDQLDRVIISMIAII